MRPHFIEDLFNPGAVLNQARNSANEALKLLTVLSRPTVKAAGQLQKRLVIEDGGHDREQVKERRNMNMFRQPTSATSKGQISPKTDACGGVRTE